jgi:Protein of unknown function (DUF1674)
MIGETTHAADAGDVSSPQPATLEQVVVDLVGITGAGCGVVPREIGGRDGPEPTRYGDWEKNGRCIDF